MKFLLFGLLVFGSALSSISQNIEKELQSNIWHGQGWFKDKTIELLKSDTKSEWHLKFLPKGVAKYSAIVKEKGYDENSRVVMPGDTVKASYKYTVKKNHIFFNAPHGKYYFKVNKLANEAGFELVAATEKDFK